MIVRALALVVVVGLILISLAFHSWIGLIAIGVFSVVMGGLIIFWAVAYSAPMINTHVDRPRIRTVEQPPILAQQRETVRRNPAD